MIVTLMLCFEAEAKDGFVSYGWGIKSCGVWTKDQAERLSIGADGNMPSKFGSNIAPQTQWVVGFISAFNYYKGATADVTNGTDMNGVFAWIDNYCAAHPLDPIAKATMALIDELSQRQ